MPGRLGRNLPMALRRSVGHCIRGGWIEAVCRSRAWAIPSFRMCRSEPAGKRLLRGARRSGSARSSERRKLNRRLLCRSSGRALPSVVRFRCRCDVVVGAPGASDRAGLAILTRVLAYAADATLMAFVACLELLALRCSCRGWAWPGRAFCTALLSRSTRTRVGLAVVYE